ncbi:MAG: preprotein translocase subunit SecA [Candidatus Marinimicrobia bacterium]|nr:preprotein translocase subunit SecA [Candidatus Neomarinimicrobiota bacterium]
MSIFSFVSKLFGTYSDRQIKGILPIIDEINQIYPSMESRSIEDLRARTQEFKEMIRKKSEEFEEKLLEQRLSLKEDRKQLIQYENSLLDEILPEAYAMVKEVCRRMIGQKWTAAGATIEWNMVPYNVQLIGGIALHQGKIAEMKTGEGKTLVASMPIYLNALTGRGVHVVTVNDYLAKRDSQWMGRIYEELGLTVGCIINSMSPDERKKIYNCDIVYGTNNELGFDYLRDNMTMQQEHQVHREFFYCIIDEVDNILIDEARTPLIISGPVASSGHEKYDRLNPSIESLVRSQKSLVNNMLNDIPLAEEEGKENPELGKILYIAQQADPKHRRLRKLLENMSYQKMVKEAEKEFLLLTSSKTGKTISQDEYFKDLYFYIEEQQHSITLTPKGEEKLSKLLNINVEELIVPDLGYEYAKIDERNDLSENDKASAKIDIDRKHSEISDRFHNISQLLRAHALYQKDVEYVLQDDKVQIVDEFTGRILPGRRYSDGLHQAIEAKEKVKVEAETQTYATITLQNYFRMYEKLAGMTGTAITEAAEFEDIYKLPVLEIPTNKPVTRIDREDQIYKTKREKYNAIIREIEDRNQKRQPVLVGTTTVEVSETISRMLKIRKIPHNVLNAKNHQRESEIVSLAGQPGAVTIATNMAGRGTDIKLGPGVKEMGGLFILGTERHESRRIDLQLRGRSGRQGDPGESIFFLSLEDDLMRLFNSDRIISIMDRLGVEEGQVITHRMVSKSIERAQKKVEGRNFSIRKHLLEYDDVMNQQREIVYDRRNFALKGKDLKEELFEILEGFIGSIFDENSDVREKPENWNWARIKTEFVNTLGMDFKAEEFYNKKPEDIKMVFIEKAREVYETREKYIGPDRIRFMERYFTTQVIDEAWKNHLYSMDQLKEGINWRAYGQKDPLLEYKGEAFQAFSSMLDDIDLKILKLCFRTIIRETENLQQRAAVQNFRTVHQDASGMGLSGSSGEQQVGKMQPVHVEKQVGRNDPCPCGSGKKFKKCHGKDL